VSLSGIEHQPQPPSWDCLACERPWPCDPARERMTRLYAATTLSIMMADRLLDAVGDMPTASPADLFDRFLAWTRRPPAG
jgi:hypothetical protein